MSIKENKDLVSRMLSGGVDQIKLIKATIATGKDPNFAPEFTVHGPLGDANLKEMLQINLSSIAAFPDRKFSVEDIIAEKDKVVVRYHGSGTHMGAPYRGLAPTGKKYKTEGIYIFRIAEGRIVELWAASDELGMMQQLGAIPSAPNKK